MKFGSLFSGFGGADIGVRAAGLDLAWGLELDPDIAAVANHNLGGHIRIGNVLDADPGDFEPVDVFHASPPCPSFSVAKANGQETALDIALSTATARFIEHLVPLVVTIENVWGYRGSQSWRVILATLERLGYWVNVTHVNFADYGVPQTRRRMIVQACLGRMVPYLPQPEPWVGWYEAIEDLIPTLPESRFAKWQLARLPKELQSVMVGAGGYDGDIVKVPPNQPAFTVTANTNQANQVRAFLLGGQFGQPANGNGDPRPAQLATDGPAFTVTAVNKGDWRAFLVGGANTSDEQAAPGVGVSGASEPTRTVNASNSNGWQAFLVDGQNARTEEKGGLPYILADKPALSVVASANGKGRAWLTSGRVVSMTPRCLARFQSFPDWYELPAKAALARKGIGNAVPPVGYEKILRGLVNS